MKSIITRNYYYEFMWNVIFARLLRLIKKLMVSTVNESPGKSNKFQEKIFRARVHSSS